MHRWLSNFLKKLSEPIFGERRCLVCAGIITLEKDVSERDAAHTQREKNQRQKTNAHICPDCMHLLQRRVAGYCPSCGEPAAWANLPLASCGRCITSPPLWQSFSFYGIYEGKLRTLLLQCKFGNQSTLGQALGMLLAMHPAIGAARVDAVIPVPLHLKRLRHRGYNQALEIARPVARILGAALDFRSLQRVKETHPQPGHSRNARITNTHEAFRADNAVRGKRILLVDDIVTSGATLQACAKVLLLAGAAEVHVAGVARASVHTVRFQERS